MGYKIKEMRQKKNMTQSELAEKSGVSRTTIYFLESGTKEQTTVDTLTKLAKALGVSISDIFFAS